MPRARLRPAIEELKNSLEPLALFRSIKDLPYSFFLDSVCDPKKLGRYSFIGCDPFLVFRSKGDNVTLEWSDGSNEELKANPFEVLRGLFNRYAAQGVRGIPFTGGATGYFSYDLKAFIEELPNRATDDLGIPDCMLGFYDSVIICDNLKKRSYVSSLGIAKRSSGTLKDIIETAARQNISRSHCEAEQSKAEAIQGTERFAGLRPIRNGRKLPAAKLLLDEAFPSSSEPVLSNFSKRSYISAVNKAKRYIKDGDIYQVNISQRFQTKLLGDPFELYVRLRRCSPAPFAAYMDFGDVAILSSSPERFLLKSGNYIETRPIKGTRPRGEDAADDLRLERELSQSAKDMAEHIMIVDLERNDLGRICRYGSVAPTESAIIERYANVFHLVSTVTGELKKGVGPIDCLLAAFPGGSITGAPKIRSMEIIDSLESVRRSIYTGAIGYIGFDGNMDTSIAIRTFIAKGKELYFQVGGGIVADSDPESEYEETLHKAAGLMQAAGIKLKARKPVSV